MGSQRKRMLEKNSRCGKRKSFHNDGFYCCKSRLISVKSCLNVESTIYVSHSILLTHFWYKKCINFPVINRDANTQFTHCLYDREKQVFLRIKLAFKPLEKKASESEVINKISERILKINIPRKNLHIGRKDRKNFKDCNDFIKYISRNEPSRKCKDCKDCKDWTKCISPNEPNKNCKECNYYIPRIPRILLLSLTSITSHNHITHANPYLYFHFMSHTTRLTLVSLRPRTADDLTEATDQYPLDERLEENFDEPRRDP